MVILLVQQATAQICSKPQKKCIKAKGVCIDKAATCNGDAKPGKKWCKDGRNCKCCIEDNKECGDGTEQPACKILGGFCMNNDEKCNGREVFSQHFCSGSSCKCCIPQETCAGCEDMAGTECGGEVLGIKYEGVCKDFCEGEEVPFGECEAGPNCRCCVTPDLNYESCEEEIEKTCSGSMLGVSITGICRTNCELNEMMLGPCGNYDGDSFQGRVDSVIKFKQIVSRMDDTCGCCVNIDFSGKR